jgi:hypothetical protein
MSFFFCHFCSVIGSSRTVGQINIIIIIIIIIIIKKCYSTIVQKVSVECIVFSGKSAS